MGVRGLWRLLLPIGRRISIETLEGKVLAIDASIWLTQFLKAMRDPETGSVKPAAHLIGFFRRLAKLRFHGIRPVLVFDGETPEIKRREILLRRKRREQFASTGQASLQRMAKKLLLEQLKKTTSTTKQSLGNGAYAPGFQLAEGEANASTNESSKPAAAPKTDPNDSHEAILAEVAGMEQEWTEQPYVESENDWDKAITDDTNDAANESTSQSSVYGHTAPRFNIDRISSLPSHERKDAIEAAQRQQRMRSRREFMPVAGQPEQYSQAQLRNFLRSSNLNKKIAEMAKKAAGNDDDQVGERMASDATRRIIFTKDGDETQPFKRLQKHAPSKLPPEEEDEEEFEWEDGEDSAVPPAKAPPPSHQPFARALVDVDDDEDADADTGAGGFLADAKMPAVAKRVVHVDDGDSDVDDDSGGGGGFLPSKSVDEDSSEGGGFLSSKPAANVDEDSAGGRVFIPTKPAGKSVIHIDDNESDDEGGGGFLPNKSTEAQHAQELEDEMLARALQDSERGVSNAEVLNSEARLPEQTRGEQSKETVEQIDRDAALAAQLQQEENGSEHLKAASAMIDLTTPTLKADEEESANIENNEEDSDDVDWEDGDQDLDMSREDKAMGSAPARDLPGPSTPTVAQSQGENSSDDEVVAWEDGDEPKKSVPQRSGGGRIDNGRTASLVTEINGGSHKQIPHKTSRSPVAKKTARSFDDEDNGFDAVPVADENALALEHAQATAANLTNWAGRAFRRAIAQLAEETGTVPASTEKASQGDAAEEDAAMDSDDSEVEVIESTNKVEPVNQAPRTPTIDDQSEPSLKQAPVESPPVASEPIQGRATAAPTSQSSSRREPPMGLFQDAAVANLQDEVDLIDSERKRQERDMDTITDEMKTEVIQLIQLFGIPYVESPAEAEAQCVKLEELGLVDGIVTEDSDVFVFGGKSVYKNIFDDQKYVEVYRSEDAEREMALGHNQMVALAMLLGGDYSDGVRGVGIVNGMEVLQAFDVSNGVKEGLTKFRKWLDGFDPGSVRKGKAATEEQSAEKKFAAKHKSARTQWVAPTNFPADNVINAYIKPVVDTSSDRFSWGTPDLDRLLVFCQRNMGWEPSDTRKLLDPVMQRLEDSSRQTRLESYFMKYDDDIKFADVKSQRLREVFQDIRQDNKESGKKRARSNS